MEINFLLFNISSMQADLHLLFLNKSNKTDRKAECICIIFTEDLFEQTLYLALKTPLIFCIKATVFLQSILLSIGYYLR